MKKTSKRYVLRVYDRSLPYDDDIYRSEENNDKIEVQFEADTLPDMLEIWYKQLEEYEGCTYCIKDMENNTLIVGGAYDPNDDDIIKEHFPFEINDELNPKVVVICKGQSFTEQVRVASIKAGDTFFVDGEPYLACEDADAESECVFSADGGFSSSSGDSFSFDELDEEAPKEAEKLPRSYALARIDAGDGLVLSLHQIEAVYRYRLHQYHLLDADRQLMCFIFGASEIETYDTFLAREILDEDERACLREFDEEYGLPIGEAYELLEEFVSRFEDNFDCNVAINTTWEDSIREVLCGHRKAASTKPAKEMYLPVHISAVEEGDVLLYDGWEYTATCGSYMTDTANGREWNVEVDGDGPEKYLYASYFPNGEVPVMHRTRR